MIVAGIDPGTKHLGMAVIETNHNQETLLEAATIKTPSGWPIAERVAHLYTRVEEIVQRRQPEVIGIEDWVYQARSNDEGITWEAQAVQRVIGALYTLSRYCAIQMVQPAHWKRQFTGYAHCRRRDETEINHAVKWAVRLRLNVNAGHRFDSHRYDAAGIALVVAGQARIFRAAGLEDIEIGRSSWKP